MDRPTTCWKKWNNSKYCSYMESFRIEHAKGMSLLLVILCICYHHYLHTTTPDKRDSCTQMLTTGRFLPGSDRWQPIGCHMYQYSTYEANSCFKEDKQPVSIVFLGDARMRSEYHSLLYTLTGDEPPRDALRTNLTYTDPDANLKVEFISSGVVDQYRMYETWVKLTMNGSAPRLVLHGGALVLDNKILPLLEQLKDTTEIVWLLPENIEGNTGSQLTQTFSTDIETIINSSHVYAWRMSPQVYGHSTDNNNDDTNLHSTANTDHIKTQMLLNMLCNDKLDIGGDLCCKSNERPSITTAQVTVVFLTIVSFGLLLCTCLIRHGVNHHTVSNNTTSLLSDNNKDPEAAKPLVQSETETKSVTKQESVTDRVYELLVCLCRLGLVLIYFILCDRQNFFMKQNKHFSYLHFVLPVIVCTILGFVFSKKSKCTTVLHRDQTDEWKGWMQLVILIYHITGASQILTIYMQIRVLVSSYLFMSGFGHFYFYFTKGDYSIYRFCVVMYRCNLLVVLLCFTMERPYQFYYFVPLVSYWFVVCYCVMSIWPRVTLSSSDTQCTHRILIVTKLLLLIALITAFYIFEWLFDVVFQTPLLAPLFELSDGSIYEWRFRWKIDRYSTVFGMVFALLLMQAKKHNTIDDSHEHNLYAWLNTTVFTSISVTALMGYYVFTQFCYEKTACNEIHAYVSFLPIVSFIILRNTIGWLRIRFSYFFAWVGKISLELFIAQYHIWLASDTHKMLVLIPGFPVLNLCVTTFIFVCIAHEIHSLTSQMSSYIVPKEWTQLIRNILVFFVVFVVMHLNIFSLIYTTNSV